MSESSPKVSLATIGVIFGLALNLCGLVGVAVALGQWKGEVSAAISQAAEDQKLLREADTRMDVELRVLTARIAQADSQAGRVDERLKSMESSLAEIKSLLRNGAGK